jgi:hypothetical protein
MGQARGNAQAHGAVWLLHVPGERMTAEHSGWDGVELGVTPPSHDMEAGTGSRSVADILDVLRWSQIETGDGHIVAIRMIPPTWKAFGFHAYDVRRQGQYTFARIVIVWELADLSWATLCIDRPDEREKLAKAAWQVCPAAVKAVVPPSELARYLGQFCADLWSAWCEANPQTEPTPITAARGYQSRWATPEQRAAIVTLRQRLGILDTSDIPEQLQFMAAVRMIEHLQAELHVG